MGKYEYTPNQQLWSGSAFMMWITGTWPWVQPAATPFDVARDKTMVKTYDYAKRMSLPGKVYVPYLDTIWAHSAPGIPAQLVNETDRKVTWTFGTTEYGYEQRVLPTPLEIWVEGMPRTRVWAWEDAPGAYDRHVIFVYPNRVVEMIGVDSQRFAAMSAVEFNLDGTRTWGAPANWGSVCAAGVQMSKYMLNKKSLDNPHVLGMALGNYAGRDGTMNTDFPKCGQRVMLETIPIGLTGDALKVAQMLHTHGAIIYDRGGDPTQNGGLLVQAGAQWRGSNLQGFNLPLDAFRLVLEAA